MRFRTRVALIIAGSIGVVVAALAGAVYLYIGNELNSSLDRSLRVALQDVVRHQADGDNDADDKPGALPQLQIVPRPGDANYFVQLVLADGRITLPEGAEGSLPITQPVLDLAGKGGASFVYETEINDVHVRVLAAPYAQGQVVLIAAPAVELDNTLQRLQLAALVLGAGGALLGAVIGVLATGATISPVRRLTGAAERVARTRDLTMRLPVKGKDEISRLTATFNDMLQALRDAEEAQRRLVADASHELRTPLASLRVNVELLAGEAGELDSAEREEVLRDIVSQAGDLGAMMTNIFELARGEERREAVDFEAAEMVLAAVETARRDWPDVDFIPNVAPWVINGDRQRFSRAVVNLLNNAAKYAGATGPIDVTLRAGVVQVADRGPGIPDDELERVFDRFHRAPRATDAPDVPGSGLGLAIVRQAMDDLGGTAYAAHREGGGSVFVLDLSDLARAGGPAHAPPDGLDTSESSA